MQAYSNHIFTIFFIFCSGLIIAQEDTTSTDDIDPEKLIIIKPFSPTVNDAVKIKQLPDKEKDSTVLGRKKIDYDIYSVPVASTFKPEKGTASGVKREKQPKIYDNYAALGAGNYTNIFAEFYSNIELDKRQNITIGLEHNSSQGGVEGVEFDDDYYDTGVDLAYNAEEDSFNWGIEFGLEHQLYNWYGRLNDDYYNYSQLENAKLKHNYTAYSLEGNIAMKKGVFEKAFLKYRHFGDDFHANENHIEFRPEFRFPLGQDFFINTDVSADFLSGKFGNAHENPSKYGWLNLGLNPSLNISGDRFKLNLGMGVVYSVDTENSKEDIYFYPKAKASYRMVGDYLTLYGGVDGGMQQNSYYTLSQENPYIAPDLAIAPTNTKFDVFAGGKGKFTDEFYYDFRASYKAQENKGLFAANRFNPTDSNLSGLQYYGNSFTVLFDDLKTLSLAGSLGYDVAENFNVGFNFALNDYSVTDEEYAWNLPEMEASLNADYQISKKWSVGGDILFVDERHDFINNANRVKANSYLDANLRVDFQLSDQLGIFARGNNLFNENYKRWYSYRVQGIQGMLGLSYQF